MDGSFLQWLGELALPVIATWGAVRFFGEKLLDTKLRQGERLLDAKLRVAEMNIAHEQAKAVEKVKAELVSEAAVRQEVARQKILLYSKLSQMGVDFEMAVILHRNTGKPDTDGVFEKLNELTRTIRINEIYMSKSVAANFYEHADSVMKFREEKRDEDWERRVNQFHAAWPKVLEAIRFDLFVSEEPAFESTRTGARTHVPA